MIGSTPPAMGAEILVTTQSPEINGGDGACSIVEAMINAEDDGSSHPDCSAGDGADTLVLPSGTIEFNEPHVSRPYYGKTALPIVTGTLSIEGNNTTLVPGGGFGDHFSGKSRILEVTGDLTINETIVSGGTEGIFARGTPERPCSLSIQGSVVRDGWDIGVRSRYCVTTLDRSAIHDNFFEGGLVIEGGSVAVINSTIAFNDLRGILVRGAELTLDHATVTGNEDGIVAGASTVTLSNSLVVGNFYEYSNTYGTFRSGGDLRHRDGGGGILSLGGNVLGPVDFDGFIPAASDVLKPFGDTSVLEETLDEESGPTPIVGLKVGSPARDLVDRCPPPGTDQRGVVRPQGVRCDAGAVEEVPWIITVTTTVPDVVSGDGQCSLVEGLVNAVSGEVRHADCPGGSGPPILELPGAGVITLRSAAIATNRLGASGLPLITRPVSINGNGATITRDPEAPPFRILTINGTGALTLRDTVISGGLASGPVDLERDALAGAGGGILVDRGSLVMERSRVTGNRAGSGGGVAVIDPVPGRDGIRYSTLTDNVASGDGGGLLARGPVSMRYSVSARNRAASGGGIAVRGEPYREWAMFDRIIVTQNQAAGRGGGLSNAGQPVTVWASTLSRNESISGGGISNDSGGNVQLLGSTVSNNTASGSGGGVFNDSSLFVRLSTLSRNAAGENGGGVANSGNDLDASEVTVSANTAGGAGGGIYHVEGELEPFRTPFRLTGSLVAGNRAGRGEGWELFLVREPGRGGAYVADNLMGYAGLDYAQAFKEVPTAEHLDNRFAIREGEFASPLVDILDLPLSFNGGFNRTHALVSESPARDLSCDRDAPSRADQRHADTHRPGVSNTHGCDNGAVDFADGHAGRNAAVTRRILEATYQSSPNQGACPNLYTHTLNHTVTLVNESGSAFGNVEIQVQALNDQGILMNSFVEGLPSEALSVPLEGSYVDGVLGPAERVEVRLTHCALIQPGQGVPVAADIEKRLHVLGSEVTAAQ